MFLDFLFNLSQVEVYVILIILMFTNGLFLFPSSQITLAVAGVIASILQMNLIIFFISLWISNFLGNYLLFLITVKYGEKTAKKLIPMKKSKLDEYIILIKYLFKHHGPLILLLGRNLPVFHSLISIPAGVSNIKSTIFITYSLLGILSWNLIFYSIGVYFGESYETIFSSFNVILILFSIGITVVIFFYIISFKEKLMLKAKREFK